MQAESFSSYHEWAADDALAEDVSCLWADPARTAPHQGLVLPDACIDIVWDGDRLLVAGPDTGPVAVAGRAGDFVAGLRFRPGRAPAFLGEKASDLLDRRIPLEDLWGHGPAQRLTDRVTAAPSAEAATSALAGAVEERRRRARGPSRKATSDPLVDELVSWLLTAPPAGAVVATASRHLDIGERLLHRRCVAAVGYGPKMLERVLRFRRAQRLAETGLSLATVAAAAGYADQAHLSRDCRRLSGRSPSDLFKTAPPPRP